MFDCAEEQVIKLILACRGFWYTRVSIISPGLNVKFKPQYYRNTQKIEIKIFDEYLNRTYMPPIEAKPLFEFAIN